MIAVCPHCLDLMRVEATVGTDIVCLDAVCYRCNWGEAEIVFGREFTIVPKNAPVTVRPHPDLVAA